MGYPVKPVTITNYARGWHSVLNDAVKKGQLIRNPMDGASLPKVERVEPALLDTDDVARVLELLKTERIGLVVRTLVVTGARRGEVLGLTWDDIDLDGDQPTAKIRRSLTTSAFGLRVGPPKTESSKRTVALDPETVRQLWELRHEHRQAAMQLGREAWAEASTVLDKADTPHGLDLVFRRDDGRPLEPRTITNRWRGFLKRHGLPHVKLHSLRHLFATVALESGVPMKVVQVQLGHSTMVTTAAIYSHVSEKVQAEATSTVMERFGS